MKLNRVIFFLTIFLQLLFFSCSKCEDIEKISGLYIAGVDGFLIKNSKIVDNGIRNLQLYSNNTFILFEDELNKKNAVSGKWEIKSCKTVKKTSQPYVESILEFTIKNRKIRAKCLGGRKIIFDHPEEFYGDKNKILKYSKRNENI